ncbi:MAG: tyrosine-type recombinase/integrase [Planctomycetes bacterium]|nr:tyrosine-type recombinase/integrase [Planctomycetota bacterium]
MIARIDAQLSDVIERFYKSRSIVKGSQTHKLYRIGFEQFDLYLEREAKSSDMADETVGPWLPWLRDVRGLAPVTVNGRRDKFLCFWRWGCRKKIFHHWPEVQKIAQPDHIPHGLKTEEIERLLRACEKVTQPVAGIPGSDWWQAIVWFWFHCGERSGATRKIRLDAVDWETGEVSAPGSIRKAGKAELHTLGPEAMEAMRKIRHPERKLLFPFPHDNATLYNRLRKIFKRAGLVYRPPKSLRISFASYLEANGGNATAALQHSSRSVTVKSYLDPSIVKREPAHKLLPKLGGAHNVSQPGSLESAGGSP